MKKLIYFYTGIFLMSITLFSCEEYLDTAPELDISEEDVFDSYDNAEGYLDNCYNALNDYSRWDVQKQQRGHISTISDEAVGTYSWSTIMTVMNGGSWLDQESSAEVGYTSSNVATYKVALLPMPFIAFVLPINYSKMFRIWTLPTTRKTC